MKRVGLMGVVALVLVVATAAVAATSGWKVQRSPNPSKATDVNLEAVSCPSSSACTAVGHYTRSESVPATLAEREHGGKWSIEHTPSPGNGGGFLFAVACTSAKACIAVGSYDENGGSVPLAERWNGKKWSVEKLSSPSGSTGAFLQGVSCTSAQACTAAGGVYRTGGPETLAERWNGKHWSVQHTPNPSGATEPTFDGVSCASPKACVALGEYETKTFATMALAERWNGKKWSILHAPHPTGTTSSQFNGVSCTAPNACTAGGAYEKTANHERTLAERWNGKKWSIQKTPDPTKDPNKFLYGVSCTSASACTAVGYTSGPLVWNSTIVEQWNGHKWSVQRSPSPGSDSQLLGVSCSSMSDCTAAGWYEKTNSGPEKTLIERR